MKHYFYLIHMFGAPNGLCSSITESKHKKAVKQPWCRSNRHEPLGQMLITNQRLDKFAAARVDFTQRRMLDGTCLSSLLGCQDPDEEIQDEDNMTRGDHGYHDNDAVSIVDGGRVDAYVELTRTGRTFPGITVMLLFMT
jgi:hypothetical protein